MSGTLPAFDRSFLQEVDFEFVVISDTHYMLDPEVYASGGDSQDVRFTRLWSGRAGWALRLAASLEASFVLHLGDLAQEYPGTDNFSRSRHEAVAQIETVGLRPYHVVGNMDIGDKPNVTVPAEWVTSQLLAEWHDRFGQSWYSFDHHGVHFVVLNSQIMNGPLPEAEEQKQWLECDLIKHVDQRVFVFSHIPPFFVDPQEPGIGHYNSMDEPAREWLLGLLRKYNVEMVFSGHTHFAAFNRVGATRLFVVPSTTTSRPGFYEVFSVCPPDRGRNDVAKLGFFLVRVRGNGASVHFIRTDGETGPTEADASASRLVTRTTHDLPNSSLGVYLRLPLAKVANGVIAWPDVVRQRVRDDYPFLGCLELGIHHLRVPISDLSDQLQRTRLEMARDEGLTVTGICLWSERGSLLEAVRSYGDGLDAVEVQTPGALWPDDDCLDSIVTCSREEQITLTLAPLLAKERILGKFHARTRVGYRAAELAVLNRKLASKNATLARVLCRFDHDASPWDSNEEFAKLRPLSHIEHVDYVVELVGLDEHVQVSRAAEAVFVAASLRDCRVFLDPLVDLDRTSDVTYGLLDRLSNPRPAFHAVRCLNTVLFSSTESLHPIGVRSLKNGRALGIGNSRYCYWLLLPREQMALSPWELDEFDVKGREATLFNLTNATSLVLSLAGTKNRGLLPEVRGAVLLMLPAKDRQAPWPAVRTI